jgi:hypothetical protein
MANLFLSFQGSLAMGVAHRCKKIDNQSIDTCNCLPHTPTVTSAKDGNGLWPMGIHVHFSNNCKLLQLHCIGCQPLHYLECSILFFLKPKWNKFVPVQCIHSNCHYFSYINHVFLKRERFKIISSKHYIFVLHFFMLSLLFYKKGRLPMNLFH